MADETGNAGGNAAAALLGDASAFGDNGNGAGGGGAGGGQAQNDGGDQAQGGGQGGAQGGGGAEWHGGLSAEADGDRPSNRDWVAAKGFRDIDGLVKAYRAAEQSLHDSGRVKIPGADAAPEELAAWRKAIGVPDEVSGYELTVPAGADGTPVPLVDGVLDRIAAAGHKHGVPKAVLQSLVADYIQGDLDAVAAQQREQNAQASAWMKAQGNAGPERVAAINRAAEALGLNADDLGKLRAAWGAQKALDFMSKLGAGISEDRLAMPGSPVRFGVSGDAATAELARLRTDPAWAQKALVKGSPENLHYLRLNEAIADWEERKARA